MKKPKLEVRGDHYRVSCLIDGKRHRETFPTKQQCYDWYVAAKMGVLPDQPPTQEANTEAVAHANDPLLSELIERYMDEIIPAKSRKRALGSRPAGQNERSQVRIISEWLGHLRLSELDADAIQAHVRARRAGKCPKKNSYRAWEPISDSSIIRELSKVSVLLNTASIAWKYHLAETINPVRAAKKIMELTHINPVENEHRDRIMSADELAVLYRAKGGEIFEFAVDSCMRRGEIYNLRFCQRIGDHGEFLHIPKSVDKNKKSGGRTIPLTERAQAILDAHPQGFGIEADTMSSLFKSVVEREGWEHANFHDLRHTGLTILANMGVDIFDLKEISGHKKIETLAKYVNKKPDGVAERVNAARAAQQPPARKRKLKVVN